ncbi:hypothetical protein [Anaerotignum sp.]|uniref:hypothetical protein n=1 Tax=Anaerotignum sp. TaxID=2039241 RepID=UPI0028A0275F|nr:hypothetical protein [Anaerotignum sp.]
MKKSVYNAINKQLDCVDDLHADNWVELGEKLYTTILERPEYLGAFTEDQKNAIVEVCRETYHAAAMTARVYAMKAIQAYDQSIFR